MTALINHICTSAASFANNYLFTSMVLGFFGALVLKTLVHYMMHAQYNFTKEFEKRVHRHLDKEYDIDPDWDYEQVVGSIMQRTWVEIYQMRMKNMRRKLDRVYSLTDRMFLVEDGSKRLITDTLKEAKYARPGKDINLGATARFVMSINPYFNSLFGLIPVQTAQNLLGIMPGLFIIAGIFGTFLGITSGIPSLKGMDPTNAEMAKVTMGNFLDNMAFSLNTSVVGIFFSVCLTIVNTVFSSKQLHRESVHKLVHGLELLWEETVMLHEEGKRQKWEQGPRVVQSQPTDKELFEQDPEELPPLPGEKLA